MAYRTVASVILLLTVLPCCLCATLVNWSSILDSAYLGEKVWKPTYMPTKEAVLKGLCPHGYFGDQSRLRQMEFNIRNKMEFNIAILGGSVPKSGNYTYPSVLQDFLRPYMPFNVTVFNFANPAAPSATQVNKFPDMRENINAADIDVVIMDVAANDAPTHAWLQRERRDTAKRNIEAEGREEMELLLNHLIKKDTALIYFETPTKTQRKKPYVIKPSDMAWGQKSGYGYNNLYDFKSMSCENQDVASNLHWVPLLSLHIPVYSYFDMGCAVKGVPFPKLWGDEIHPHDPVHRFAGTALGLGLLELINMVSDTTGKARVCPSESSDSVLAWDEFVAKQPVVEKMARVCSYNRSSYYSSTTQFEPSWRGAAWRYYEDVPNKPGWISDHKHSNSTNSSTDWDIHFKLKFAARAHYHVRLNLLMSYVNEMGTLQCCLDCDVFFPEFSCVTHIRDKFSVMEEFVFIKDVAPNVRIDASAEHTLKCRAEKKKKVKITAVVGC